MQKTTNPVFSEVIKMLKENVHPTTGIPSPLVAEDIYAIVMSNKEWFDSAIDHKRDFAYGYFGYKTLERSYLFKINNKIVERPQHMIMRVAVGIHGDNLEKVKEVRKRERHRYTLTFHVHAANTKTPFADLRVHVRQVLHPRHPHPLQRRNPQAAAQLVLPPHHEGRFHRGHLRHPEAGGVARVA